MNPPITVLSPTGHPVHRHVHATGVTRGFDGPPLLEIDGVLFVVCEVKS